MSRADRLETVLTEAFAPSHLEVIDESEQHRGHGGYREGGESHYRIVMRAAAFDGMNRVARSRAVHKVLADELEGETAIHALALQLQGEAEA
ncbi:BolA family protein [Paracoccaceae bacterium GXU_MW_L88]